MTDEPKYFVGRCVPERPYKTYSRKKYFDTSEIIWRGNSLEEGRGIAKNANKARALPNQTRLEL